jgi:hypothetical protein
MRIFFVCLVFSACQSGSTKPTSQQSNLATLESGIAASVSLGHGSSIAMAKMANTNTACASVRAACAGYPCDGEVVITLGSGCPLPLGGEATGTIEVSGSWSSEDSATLSNTFIDVKAGTQTQAVVDASNLTVTRGTDSVQVRYTWQNVNVESGVSTLGAQSLWTTEVDLSGTPDDPADDVYTITGADQSASINVSQISASNVVIDPSCRKNPIAGSATIQKVSGVSIYQATIRFHEACDGKADVNGVATEMKFLQ